MQAPRVRFAPRAAANDAEDAIYLATSYGLVPDPWQETVLRGWLGTRARGLWAATQCGLAVPRQNGKNGALEIRELHGMVTLGERFLHTAHEVKTARKAFARLLEFFDNPREYPELSALVKEVRRTNGQEAIVLDNGGSVEFVARSKGSGRGFSVDVLVMDEAQELDEDSLAALLPTISVSPNPQQIMTGTPPGPRANGEVFSRVRKAAIDRKSRRLCWLEWGCIGRDLDVDDRANWAKANPTLGIRLRTQTIEDERAAMDEDTFARERLGVWDDVETLGPIDLERWASLADANSAIAVVPTFAIDVPPDRSSTSIGVAGLRHDGLEHVEVVDNQRGTGWVVDRMVEISKRWKVGVTIDAAGPAGSLIAPLEAAGVEVHVVSARDVGQACGGLVDAVKDGRLRHLSQAWLNDAVEAARKRPLGDAFAWQRKDPTTNISPLVAVTLARHAALAQPPKRKRTGKVW